jgi:hypothetical protein
MQMMGIADCSRDSDSHWLAYQQTMFGLADSAAAGPIGCVNYLHIEVDREI